MGARPAAMIGFRQLLLPFQPIGLACTDTSRQREPRNQLLAAVELECVLVPGHRTRIAPSPPRRFPVHETWEIDLDPGAATVARAQATTMAGGDGDAVSGRGEDEVRHVVCVQRVCGRQPL